MQPTDDSIRDTEAAGRCIMVMVVGAIATLDTCWRDPRHRISCAGVMLGDTLGGGHIAGVTKAEG